MITVFIFNEQFSRAKLLIKVVAVPREQIVQDFDVSWAHGIQSSGGEVKKVVEIYNPLYSISKSSQQVGNDAISEVSGASWSPQHGSSNLSVNDDMETASALEITMDTNSNTLMSESFSIPKLNTTKAELAFSNKESKSEAEQKAKASDATLLSSRSLSNIEPHGVQQLISQISTLALEVGGHTDAKYQVLAKAAAQLIEIINKEIQDTNTSANENKSVVMYDHTSSIQAYSLAEEEKRDNNVVVTPATLHKYSTLASTHTKSKGRARCGEEDGRSKYALEVFGAHLKDADVKQIIELRTCEVIDHCQRDRLVAIDVQNTQVASLQQMLGALFQDFSQVSKGNEEAGGYQQDRVERQLIALRTAFLHDHLRSLSITYSKLYMLEHQHVNSFQALTALYLNGNSIKVIDGELELPHLRLLDLSNNHLKSLDHLQFLVNLSTLLVANNRIESLENSITVLLPLVDSLATLDLSGNPVCHDHNYADEALLALSGLKHLDGLDLDSLVPSYRHSMSKKALPAFPCMQPVDSNSTLRTSNTSASVDSRANVTRVDFEKRVRRALEGRLNQQRKDRSSREHFERRTGAQSQPQPQQSSTSPPRGFSAFNWESQGMAREEVKESLQSLAQYVQQRSVASLQRSWPASPSPPLGATPASASSVRHSTPAMKASASPTSFALPTSASKQRRTSQHPFRPSADRACVSEGESARSSSRGLVEARLRAENFDEMQQPERYSIWHPRYRVPQPVFGYSKPFLLRDRPRQLRQKTAPLFEKTVQRIREGFTKLPTRGTFTRANKGLTAEWYPMDYTDLETIRRQGYFHETIGSIQRASYLDPKQTSSLPDSSVLLPSPSSATLSVTKPGRRSIIGQHVSRQHRHSVSFNEVEASLHGSSALEHSRSEHDGDLSDADRYLAPGGAACEDDPSTAARPQSSNLSSLFPGMGQYQGTAGSVVKTDFSAMFAPEESPDAAAARPPVQDDQPPQDMESYLHWLEAQYSATHNIVAQDEPRVL